jgi:deoxyadenosine/deoxycytidine kinase
MANGRTYIAVAGNIGAGKSTLVEFLCRTYGIQPFFEPNDDNPYLPDFYGDMRQWSFHSQVFFLSHKFRIHQALDQTPGTVVQDRTIYEDAEIFASALHAQGKMSDRDFQTYQELYETILTSLKPPDLMIYLRCSMRTLKRRIKLRGREMEQDIPHRYLKLLNDLYEDWIERYTDSEVLVLDTEKMDYLSDMVHRLDVMKRIESVLPAENVQTARACMMAEA